MKKSIIFRLDDVGSSSKKFEVYSKFFLGNFLFLKYLPGISAWGPYPELTESDWVKILEILIKHKAKITIAVTAAWVEKNGTLTNFIEKFPKQARVLKLGLKENLIEIANHGLTHCVVGEHLPKLFYSNRKFHREFWAWIPTKVHFKHLVKSQKILESYFGRVLTFVPPGNVWTKDTEVAAVQSGLKYLCARRDLVSGKRPNGLTYVDDSATFAFHDRDIVKKGLVWLENKILEFQKKKIEIITVADFVKRFL